MFPTIRQDINNIEKVQRRATNMIKEIRCHSYSQRLKDPKLSSIEQLRLREQLIKVFKYLNGFTTANERTGISDNTQNGRTRNHGAKFIVKHFNASVAQHIYQIKITTNRNALTYELVSSGTVNLFMNGHEK